jgi:hypothetical protein
MFPRQATVLLSSYFILKQWYESYMQVSRYVSHINSQGIDGLFCHQVDSISCPLKKKMPTESATSQAFISYCGFLPHDIPDPSVPLARLHNGSKIRGPNGMLKNDISISTVHS